MNKIEWTDDATVQLEISAGSDELEEIKKLTSKKLQPEVSAPGFRKGKVPVSRVEASVGDDVFKNQYLDDALTELLDKEIKKNKLRPLGSPKVEIKKFVPYSNLEFSVTLDVVGKIKLADYKKFKVKKETMKVGSKDIDDVIESLRTRLAEKKEVERAAKDGDEAVIDFDGKDSDGKEVQGAKGKDYPLALGSNTFIKGFEPEVVGLKPGDTKEFTVTFPADYAHKPLANKDVTFNIEVKSVKEVAKPEINDELAKKAGPFTTLDELKTDIEKQLKAQKEKDAQHLFQDKILRELIENSEIPVPQALLEDQQKVQLDEFMQNLTYRGITMKDYLDQIGLSEEEFIAKEIKPQSENKVKVGLALSEVAVQEELKVSDEEIEIRKQLMKNQYQDPAMQAQLDSPEANRDVASRLLSEKTIDKLVEYVSN